MRAITPITTAIVTLLFAGSGLAPANAATEHRTATSKVVSSVIETSTVAKRYIDKSQSVSSCSVGRSGGTCTISKGKTATRTVQLSLGITRKMVAASFGFSEASSVTTTVSCNSPVMKAGEVWRAYAVGPRHRYKAKDVTLVGYLVAKTETSGWLYAFDPKSADLHCQ